MSLGRLSAALSLAVVFCACGSVSGPSANPPEVFSGTLAVGGLVSHTFTASKNGELTVVLTTLTPTTGNAIRIGYGIFTGGGCQAINAALVTRGQTAVTTYIDKGTYCVFLADPGTLTQSETYSISVSHP